MRTIGDALSFLSLSLQSVVALGLSGVLSWPALVLAMVAATSWGSAPWTPLWEAAAWTVAAALAMVPMVLFGLVSALTMVGALAHLVRFVIRVGDRRRRVDAVVPPTVVEARVEARLEARLGERERSLGERIRALHDLRATFGDAPDGDLALVDRARLALEERRLAARGAIARLGAADALAESDIHDDLMDARARADATFEIAGVRAA